MDVYHALLGHLVTGKARLPWSWRRRACFSAASGVLAALCGVVRAVGTDPQLYRVQRAALCGIVMKRPELLFMFHGLPKYVAT